MSAFVSTAFFRVQDPGRIRDERLRLLANKVLDLRSAEDAVRQTLEAAWDAYRRRLEELKEPDRHIPIR